jgi:hypothetical protein
LVAVADKVRFTDALSAALAPTMSAARRTIPARLCAISARSRPTAATTCRIWGALRDQEDLFGRVASSTTAFSVIASLCAEGCSSALRAARAKARERVWKLGGRPDRIVSRPRRDADRLRHRHGGGPGNLKGGFRFHRMLC